MASSRLNIARIRGCPAPAAVIEALEDFGLPESGEYAVLNHSAGTGAVYATVVRRTQQTLQRLDSEAREVVAAPVEKATVLPFGVNPGKEVLEVYAGSASAIEQVGEFLSGGLALPAVIDPIELDILSAIEKLSGTTKHFQLRSARVSEYAHNSYMSGPYGPKFLDTVHGTDFLGEYAEYITAAAVRFAGPTGRATVTLSPKACFSFSCNEEDETAVQTILRSLV